MIGKLSVFSDRRARAGERVSFDRQTRDDQVFRSIGLFLKEHRLAPTPLNYGLAYAVLSGSNPAAVAAVARATDGGLRLSQADADAIVAQIGSPCASVSGAVDGAAMIAPATNAVVDLMHAIDRARDRFDQYAGIVDTSRQDALAYREALTSEAATLAPEAATAGDAVAALLGLTQSMIAKTRRAEEQLRAASVEMSDLRADLAAARQDAETDPLTGLPNRRAFEACFAERAAAESDQAMALALCDIDLFKGVNDRYGHDVGDRVIRLVAKELALGCAGSVVARYGGEEFAILVIGSDATEAAAILDRTRASLSRRSFRVAGTGEMLENLSFSGGVVAVGAAEACRDAIRRADLALYRAKQAGRNRIELG